MPDSEDRRSVLRDGLVGVALGSLLTLFGSLVVADQQGDREDDNRLRDRREALYVKLLAYEREVIYGEEDDLIATAVESLDAMNNGRPLPAPAPTPDTGPDLLEAQRLAQRSVVAAQDHRELMAEVEVYGSSEVSRLFTDFFSAQTDEVVAVAEAASSEDDDDTAAERRRKAAQQAQAQLNFELSQQVREEVADG